MCMYLLGFSRQAEPLGNMYIHICEKQGERDSEELYDPGAGEVWILQGRPAGWRPRKELILQLKSEGGLEAEFYLFQGSQSIFS